jgi:hypothetical protein
MPTISWRGFKSLFLFYHINISYNGRTTTTIFKGGIFMTGKITDGFTALLLILVVIFALVSCASCGTETRRTEDNDNFKEIQVNEIQVNTIQYENVMTENIITENTITE